jgi:DNA repair exonuclease SbcCD nuclease subunit
MRTILLSLLLACASLQGAGPEFFVQLTDPQLGMYADNADSLQEQANLRFAVASINRLKPRFVVVSGDLVNKPGDPEQIRIYREIMRGVDRGIPVYNVAGNHDLGNQPDAAALGRYRRAFGKDYYAFDAGGLRGLVLDSNLIKAPQNAPDDAAAQERWLVAELQRAQRDKVAQILVFQHIPYFVFDPQEPEEYDNLPPAARERILKLFREYGVKYVFAGHRHGNACAHAGELTMVTTGPVGKPFHGNASGFRVVRVAGGAVESRYYELGAIPHSIEPGAALPETAAGRASHACPAPAAAQ